MPGILTEFWVVIWSCLFTITFASISIFDANSTLVDYFEDLEYDYDQIPKEGIIGYLWLSKPYDGCRPIEPPPFQLPGINWLVLMNMEGCRLNHKLQYAMESNYSALILVKPPFPSNYTPLSKENSQKDIVVDDFLFDNLIPAVVVTSRSGTKMATYYLYSEETRYIARLESYLINLGNYLWPFVGTIALLILLVILVMVSRYVRDRRQEQRRRLSSKNLKQIPVHKFKKGDTYEVCAICLEPYQEDEKLRVLPCHHAFHCKCVDPWLTKNKRECPICKRKINRSGGMSDSDSEDDTHSDSQSAEDTPLLAPAPETSQSWYHRLRARFSRNPTANTASLNSNYGTLDESHASTSHPNINV